MTTSTIAPDLDTIIGEVFIAAPPARVFEAITDASQIFCWWGQQGLYRITEWHADLRPGGKWSSVGVTADGSSFHVEGEYLEVESPRRLVHTWISSFCCNLQTIVFWELEATDVHALHSAGPRRAGTGTLLTIRQQGFGDALQSAKDHLSGWTRVLGWVQAYLEDGETFAARQAIPAKTFQNVREAVEA